MTHLRLLHGGLYVDHAALATEAFRNDRKARRVLLDLWEGRKPRQPIEWLIRPVLEYHGLDTRQWRDWIGPVCKGGTRYLRERGKL